jgi:hypothetical protein
MILLQQILIRKSKLIRQKDIGTRKVILIRLRNDTDTANSDTDTANFDTDTATGGGGGARGHLGRVYGAPPDTRKVPKL